MIQLCVNYYIEEDNETIGIRFDFMKYYPTSPVCKIQLSENPWHRADKVTASSSAGSTIYLENKETLTIEIWVGDAVIAGGLYQVDTKQEYEDYILRCLCAYGIELSQYDDLRDAIDYEHERYEEERRDTLEGILASLDTDNIPYELKDGTLRVNYPIEE